MAIRWTKPNQFTCAGCGAAADGAIFGMLGVIGPATIDVTLPPGWWVGFDDTTKQCLYVCSEECGEKRHEAADAG